MCGALAVGSCTGHPPGVLLSVNSQVMLSLKATANVSLKPASLKQCSTEQGYHSDSVKSSMCELMAGPFVMMNDSWKRFQEMKNTSTPPASVSVGLKRPLFFVIQVPIVFL